MKASLRAITDYEVMSDRTMFRLDVLFKRKQLSVSFPGEASSLKVPKGLNGCAIGDIDLDMLSDMFRKFAKEIDKSSGRKRRK